MESDKLQKSVQEELVRTSILVEASKWSSKLNWRYNTYCLYPHSNRAEWKVYVIGNKRNQVLSFLCNDNKISVVGNRRFNSGDSCDFFWGWSIQFTYNNKYFQWQRDGYVRIIEDLENCEPVIKDDSKDKPEEMWYCFSPTQEMGDNTNLFIDALNCLIDQSNNDEKFKSVNVKTSI